MSLEALPTRSLVVITPLDELPSAASPMAPTEYTPLDPRMLTCTAPGPESIALTTDASEKQLVPLVHRDSPHATFTHLFHSLHALSTLQSLLSTALDLAPFNAATDVELVPQLTGPAAFRLSRSFSGPRLAALRSLAMVVLCAGNDFLLPYRQNQPIPTSLNLRALEQLGYTYGMAPAIVLFVNTSITHLDDRLFPNLRAAEACGLAIQDVIRYFLLFVANGVTEAMVLGPRTEWNWAAAMGWTAQDLYGAVAPTTREALPSLRATMADQYLRNRVDLACARILSSSATHICAVVRDQRVSLSLIGHNADAREWDLNPVATDASVQAASAISELSNGLGQLRLDD
ncbi:hypothetical protein HMN09_01205400 [Mycena chlorophos]|uniref:Uncharacterized protein n=1 Tax=Mycena chlorophos TaxID=658473 RepID=A0A8H6VX07_MYCCL|nr:hypothetical protein HMN09_01205400 [Mycena chlorophos]